MLTKELGLMAFDFQRLTVTVDRLLRKSHGHYLSIAEELIQIYRQHVGETRRFLHERVRRRLQEVADCPTRRIGAFCKLLDDASEYQQGHATSASKLRKKVFSLAAQHHPLVQLKDALFESDETTVKQQIAIELGMPWSEIESNLFADVIEYHRLAAAPAELDGAMLLARYNVAQVQVALYDATSIVVWAKQDFKTILRYAKLARLMHTINRQGDAYLFRFNGPVSVMRDTKRYGVSFAKFLPGLLSAKQWRLKASILGPGRRYFALNLSDHDGLTSEVQAEEFDSQVEETFAKAWESSEVGGWKLNREGTILHVGQTVFMPDFALTHPEHPEVLLEIIGFWTPEYLKEKVARLEQFRNRARIMLAIENSIQHAIPELNLPRVIFKKQLKPAAVLERLNELD